MKLSIPQDETFSKIERCLSFLTMLSGEILSWGTCILVHFQIITMIISKMEIDILSYPDTLVYRLLFAYLLLTQFAFIVWLRSGLDKVLGYIVTPIKFLIKALEEKYGN